MAHPRTDRGATVTQEGYGSDVAIGMLAALGIEYAVINPGASFRGLHESLVSAGCPRLVLALSENIAVAAGHGYAKAAGRPMAVFLHNLVGLQSGSMSIFNAWADQVPVLILGGSGPADATIRRPWIEWIHSCRVQALAVRDYVKWDDQPASLPALADSLRRAHRIATTVPYGPAYVAIDVGLQEQRLEAGEGPPADLLPPSQPTSITAPAGDLEQVADLLVQAERPVIIADYVGRSEDGYHALTRLAETLAAPVIDLMARHNFPTGHWADATSARRELLADADVILCLDLRDLMSGLGEPDAESHGYRLLARRDAKVISISTNQLMLKGFIDYSAPAPAWLHALDVLADTATCLPVLAELVTRRAGKRADRRRELARFTARVHDRSRSRLAAEAAQGLTMAALSEGVRDAVADGPWQVANGHVRGYLRAAWDLTDFNAHLGSNIGAGLGYGIGVSIGAALAHEGDDTLIVNLQPDGDLMYTPGGLWTAARYQLPILTVMVNNRTYAQDLMHQTLMARVRGRSADAGTGIHLDNPDIDFAMLARAQGVEAWGPVTGKEEMARALALAAKVVRDERRPALVDVVLPRQVP